jgi:hypothetical protein
VRVIYDHGDLIRSLHNYSDNMRSVSSYGHPVSVSMLRYTKNSGNLHMNFKKYCS